MIILFAGRRGTGKTIALTQQVISHLNKGRTVYVNYKVNHESPLLKHIVNLDELDSFLRADVMGTLALDMAELYFSPTRSKDDQIGRDLVNWSQDNILYLSCQSLMMPNGFVNHCDIILECEYNKKEDAVYTTQTFQASAFFNSYDTFQILKRN